MIYRLKLFLIKLRNKILPTETITNSKTKWNSLAKQNARYFVLTNQGEGITEEQFKAAGKKDVDSLLLNDPLINETIPNLKEAQVLEIGCGLGRLSEYISENCHSLIAVDISEEMIAQAKVRLAHRPNISFIATDGQTLPAEDQTVDLVFSFIVFQHMPSVEVIKSNIKEINRVLKNGGMAKIQLRGLPVSKENWYYGPSFDEPAVLNLLQGTDLQLVKTDGLGNKYFWVWLKK